MTDDTAKSAEQKDTPEAAASQIDWADPDVPAGDAPPLPRWPLVVSGLAFAAWVVFLVVMAVIRFQTTQV